MPLDPLAWPVLIVLIVVLVAQVVLAARRRDGGRRTSRWSLRASAATRRLDAQRFHAELVQSRGEPLFYSRWRALSDNQRAVAVGLARGLANAEIARELGVAKSTVTYHVAELEFKFDSERREQLAARIVACIAYDPGK